MSFEFQKPDFLENFSLRVFSIPDFWLCKANGKFGLLHLWDACIMQLNTVHKSMCVLSHKVIVFILSMGMISDLCISLSWMMYILCVDYWECLGDWQCLDVNTAVQAVHICGLIQQCVCDMNPILIIGRTNYRTVVSAEKIRTVCIDC